MKIIKVFLENSSNGLEEYRIRQTFVRMELSLSFGPFEWCFINVDAFNCGAKRSQTTGST